MFYFLCHFVVTCSEPNNPINGYLREITSSTIQFGCNEGYSPQDTMTAVCIGSDIWSPDPAQLKCTTLPPGIITKSGCVHSIITGLLYFVCFPMCSCHGSHLGLAYMV